MLLSVALYCPGGGGGGSPLPSGDSNNIRRHNRVNTPPPNYPICRFCNKATQPMPSATRCGMRSCTAQFPSGHDSVHITEIMCGQSAERGSGDSVSHSIVPKPIEGERTTAVYILYSAKQPKSTTEHRASLARQQAGQPLFGAPTCASCRQSCR